MAIQHLVWLKQKQHVTDEEMSDLLNKIRQLSSLDGVLSITAGSNFTDRANGFTHGVCVEVESKSALESYISSPEHQALGGSIRALCDLLALDYDDGHGE